MDATWAKLSLTVQRSDGGLVDAELLRPRAWIELHGLRAGELLPLHLAELEVSGPALVTAIEACPPIASGAGSVVTARFVTREVHRLVSVELLGAGGELETLTGTPVHPVWSLDRDDWVPLAELTDGETLQGHTGPALVVHLSLHQAAQPVYNLEVHGEHVYQVGELGVLVHNATSDDCIKLVAPRGAISEALEEGAIRRTTLQRAGASKSPDHHLYPQELRDEFAKRGFKDIDNFLVRLDQGTHEALHYKLPGDTLKGGFWNNEFLRRMTDVESRIGQLDRRQILRIGAQMRRDYLPGVKLLRD